MSKSLPTVAIIGQANVGKSSLFNRLVRSQQAIVAREAGTTRDNVLGKVSYNDHNFWLVDTAGLKDPDDEFEASIQEQITEAADAADVILVTVDSTSYISDEDRFVAKKALKSKKPVILLVNKTDLKGSLPSKEFERLGIKTVVRTSAEHNQGVHKLLDVRGDGRNHEMHVQWQVCVGPQGPHHLGANRDVGNEVPIHHVDMDVIRASGRDGSNLFPQFCEVGSEDRGGDFR